MLLPLAEAVLAGRAASAACAAHCEARGWTEAPSTDPEALAAAAAEKAKKYASLGDLWDMVKVDW